MRPWQLSPSTVQETDRESGVLVVTPTQVIPETLGEAVKQGQLITLH